LISFTEVSGHGLQITTAANPSASQEEDQYWSAADDALFGSDDFARSEDTVYSPSNRYVAQRKSSTGKLAYVVFVGRDVGVFYNWYVNCQYLKILLTILLGLRALPQ